MKKIARPWKVASIRLFDEPEQEEVFIFYDHDNDEVTLSNGQDSPVWKMGTAYYAFAGIRKIWGDWKTFKWDVEAPFILEMYKNMDN
jgi:hypothetical protein